MGRRKAAASRLEQARADHAEAERTIGQLEAERADALLADRDADAARLDAELETARRIVWVHRDKIALLQAEAQREEAEARVRRHQEHIAQVERLLGEREQTAAELADATAKLVAAFRKTIACSERIGAAWPWAGHDRNAALLTAQTIHATLAHEFFRTSHVPFLGGRPGEKPVPSLPGSLSSRMTEWLGFPEREPSLVNVCKDATAYASRRMREAAADMPPPAGAMNSNGAAAAEPPPNAGPVEPPPVPRLAEPGELSVLLARQAELSNDLTAEGEAKYQEVIARIAELQ